MKIRRLKNAVSSKSSKKFSRKFPQNNEGVSSDSGDDVNPNDFYHDEIDDFHSSQEKILLSGEIEHSDDDNAEEEILPITDDEDSDQEDEEGEEEIVDDDDDKDQYANIESNLASDLDDKSDDGLPNLEAWGKKKSLYFNADFVDKDRGKSYRENDAEEAKAEELGALSLQKNYGESEITGQLFDDERYADDDDDEEASEEEVVAEATDSNVVSKQGKIKRLNRDSPEIFMLVKDFKDKMKELIERLQPLVPLVKDGRLPPGNGAEYIIMKHHLILHYCANISFYMVLKSQCMEAKYHPVMKRLNSYKLLLNKLEPLGEKLKPEIDVILQKLRTGQEICIRKEPEEAEEIELNDLSEVDELTTKGTNTKIMYEDQQPSKKQKLNKSVDTEAEKEIASLYMDMKKMQRGFNYMEDSEDEEQDEEEFYRDEQLENVDENDGAGQRRAVTYQIAKNKGILPYRKKEYRNPRVRNRMKFKKAQIRRKGQVREPRKEITRYGGEFSGIRSNVIKSIKIK